MRASNLNRLRIAGYVIVIIALIAQILGKVLEHFTTPLWVTFLLIGFGAVLSALSLVIEHQRRRVVIRSYRKAMRSLAKDLSNKPFPSGFILPLCEEVRDELQHARSAAKPPTNNIEEALSESRHIVIEGEAGTGKSTVLNSIVLGRISTKHNGEPVRISAKPFAATKTSLPTSILDAVKKELGKRLGCRLPEDFFEIPPTPRGSWMILLDGLDEIGSREDREDLMLTLRDHINDQDSVYRLVVTTRPLADDPHLFDQFRRYRLLPFRPEQIKEWAKQWFASRADASPKEAEQFLTMLTQYTEVVQVPLLLTMAARLYESDRVSQLPTRRAALYGNYVAFRLNDDKTWGDTRESIREQWDRRYGAQAKQWADAVINARRELLEHLAFWKQDGGTGALADEATNYWVAREFVPRHVDRKWLCEWAETLLLRTKLLTQSTGEITFAHHTFPEYLAASAVANSSEPNDDAAQALIGRWLDSGWREVVFFALGIWTEKGTDLTAALSRLRSVACDRARGPYDRALAAEALGIRARAEGAKAVLEEARGILLDISQEPGGDPGDVLQPLDAICRLGSDQAATLFTELARRGDPYGQAVPYLTLLERSDKVLELLQDPAVGLETRMRAVYAVEAASNARKSEAVPILRHLLRNAEQFALGPQERYEIEKTLQSLS